MNTKVALITFPSYSLPGGNVFHTLHGYWIPPDFVKSFWSGGCLIEFISDTDYLIKQKLVRESHEASYKQFWRENVL